jgi:hypothetical protein
MIEFVARGADMVEDRDLECFSVVFAEDPDGAEGTVLELHRGFSFDDDERERGWDTYNLVTDLGGGCVYGGVLSWTLRDGVLEIRLDARAQAALEVDDGFRIDLRHVEAAKLSAIEAGLRRVLAEVP